LFIQTSQLQLNKQTAQSKNGVTFEIGFKDGAWLASFVWDTYCWSCCTD
jgi:hypothetical protein